MRPSATTAGVEGALARLCARYAAAVAPPPLQTISQWCDTYRMLPASKAESGRWNTNRNPAFREPMDAAGDRSVAQITIVACAQSGKTAATLGMIGAWIDQAPGPILLVLPDETTAERRLREDLKPMIEATPRLRRHVTGWSSDWRTEDIHLIPCSISLAWANSPAALADRSVRYLVLDEVGKFKSLLGKEADPVSLAKQRVVAWRGRSRIVVLSTPTTSDSLLQREWDASDQRRFHFPCPACGEYQAPEFERLKWPSKEEGRTPDEIKLLGLAEYECAHCAHRIPDTPEAKRSLLVRGVWVPAGCTVDKGGQLHGQARITDHRGYHLHGLLAFNRPWSDLAAKFLRSYRDRGALRDFYNSDLGLPFDEIVEKVETSSLLKRVMPYESGRLPSNDIELVVAGVDVGKPQGRWRLHYVIHGFGLELDNWLVAKGEVEHWEILENVLFRRSFARPDGVLLDVELACVDSSYDTLFVYEWTRKWGERARPVKGHADLASGKVYQVGGLDHDARGHAAKVGLQIWHVNTGILKGRIMRSINAAPGDPGQFYVHSNPGQDYCEQITSEHQVKLVKGGVEKMVWQVRPGAPGNHYLDATVYAHAAAEMRGAHTFYRDDVVPSAAPARVPREEREDAPRRGSWVGGDSNWIGGDTSDRWIQ